MKTVYLIILLILVGCEPMINNDEQTLNKIFEMHEFDIEIGQYGCFGGKTDLFKLVKTESAYTLSNKEFKKSMELESKQIDSLKSFLKNRIIISDKFGLCTASMYFRAGTMFSSIDFTDESCRDWDNLNEIISFSTLLSE